MVVGPAKSRILTAVGLLSIAIPLSVGCSRPSSVVAPERAATLFDLSERLSEAGAYFDTDNLISNETAYVQVIDDLDPTALADRVYIGVGPEQNFNYIGRLRPEWAFVVDIRPDNRLHHLLMNAILVAAPTPYDYLCWTFARDCRRVEGERTFDEMLDDFEAADPSEKVFDGNLTSVIEHITTELGFSLAEEERATVRNIYRSFFAAQTGLRFNSHGRAPMPHHPSYEMLMRAETPQGAPASFLSRPADYEHVRTLAREGRLVPVVGDFAGEHALLSISEFMAERRLTLSAFYLSNVEFYLIRAGSYHAFVENVRALPRDESSQLIRAYFSYGYPHPLALPGHRSTLVRQRATRFLDLYDRGVYRDYWEVCTLDYIE